MNNLSFGPEYFIPKPVDPRLITEVSCAVARAAMESGVARTEIKDWDAYCVHLRELMGYESKLTRQLYDTARRSPQRVVFAEGIHPNMLKAAVEAKAEGICHPILLGNDEAIGKLAEELDLSLEGIEIVNLRHPDESERRERYSRILAEKRAREGFTYEEANDKMFERNYFGMMMVETGDADAFITGLYTDVYKRQHIYSVTTYLIFFIILQNEKQKTGIKMKLRYYQIAIRYKNKMHDFHGWGVSAQI